MCPWSFDVKFWRIKGECTMMKATVAGKSCHCDSWESQITEQEKSSVIFYTLLLGTCNKAHPHCSSKNLFSSVWELQIITVNPVLRVRHCKQKTKLIIIIIFHCSANSYTVVILISELQVIKITTYRVQSAFFCFFTFDHICITRVLFTIQACIECHLALYNLFFFV